MARLIIKVSRNDIKSLKFDLENNPVFIGAVWGDKAEVLDYKRVTSKLIDDVTDEVMDIVTEGGHGETQLSVLRPEVRKAIWKMILSSGEENS